MDKQVYEFITAQTGEKIVERRKCTDCGQEFAITDKDLNFYSKVSPIFNGTKYEIPAPTLCPECRQQRRLARRNERKLYKRKCDLTGKTIISIYSPDSPYKVYESKEWRGDNRDPMDYSRDFDFTRPFFEQFDELSKIVPKISLNTWNNNENSDYNNYISYSKNCYLNFGIDNSENVFYSSKSSHIKDSIEINNCSNIENSAYVERSGNTSNSFFIDGSIFIRDSFFVKWSRDIDHWIFCLNIVNKQYAYQNKEISKSDYEKIYQEIKSKIKTYSWLTWFIRDYDNFLKQFPVLSAEMTRNENCYWVLVSNSKNCSFVYSIVAGEDCKYSYDSAYLVDCMDIDIAGNGINHSLEVINCFWCTNIFFSESVFENSRDVFYSLNCANNSSNLFGCIGLTNKQYCILNKQYTKEEYEQLVPKIIKHMQKNWERGQFFAPEISPFGYNETIANEYYSLDRDEALKKWFKRQDKEYPINMPEGIELIRAKDLPDNIDDVSDDILKKAIVCEVSGKPFRIMKSELDFYRKHWLALPRQHQDVRYTERLRKMPSRKIYFSKCDKCGKQIISVYPADTEFKVYCQECYDEETY